MQKISTRIAPSFSRVLCVRALGYSHVACCRSGCCLFSKDCFRELVRPKRVFDKHSSPPEQLKKFELNAPLMFLHKVDNFQVL